MQTNPNATTIRTLEDLDKRIELRIREFRERGEFANIDDSYLAELDERRSKARQRLETVVKAGNPIAIVAAEIHRELLSIADNLTKAVEQLDAKAMKRSG